MNLMMEINKMVINKNIKISNKRNYLLVIKKTNNMIRKNTYNNLSIK
jgi:hypothetical protein